MNLRLQNLRFRVGILHLNMSHPYLLGSLQVFLYYILQVTYVVLIVQELNLFTITCVLNVYLNNYLIFLLSRAQDVDYLSTGLEILWSVFKGAGLESNFSFFFPLKIIHHPLMWFHWSFIIFLLDISLKRQRKRKLHSL